MILLIHILIALSSLAFASYLLFSPSRRGIKAAYYLVASTVASGGLLVVVAHASMIQSCMTGLIYLAAVFSVLGTASYRLKRLDSATKKSSTID